MIIATLKDIYATLLKEANISLASVPKHVYTNPQKRIYVFSILYIPYAIHHSPFFHSSFFINLTLPFRGLGGFDTPL